MIEGLPTGAGFALIAVTRCRSKIRTRLDLNNGTIILPGISAILDEHWRLWLGLSRVGQVERANLVLLRHAPSELRDTENKELVQRLTDVFGLLQFSGIVPRQTTILVTGKVETDRLSVREVRDVRSFYTSPKAQPLPVTVSRLEHAEAAAAQWATMLKSHKFKRIIRGANVLMVGLRQYYGQERLHQFVRALEALIMPQIAATRRQFVHRCQTFTQANQQHATLLDEMFAMRSAVEHLHESESALPQYPDPAVRLATAERRTRQAEALATLTYSRLLATPDLKTHFETDTSIEAFWKLQDHQRKAIWGSPVDLTAVA